MGKRFCRICRKEITQVQLNKAGRPRKFQLKRICLECRTEQIDKARLKRIENYKQSIRDQAKIRVLTKQYDYPPWLTRCE